MNIDIINRYVHNLICDSEPDVSIQRLAHALIVALQNEEGRNILLKEAEEFNRLYPRMPQ